MTVRFFKSVNREHQEQRLAAGLPELPTVLYEEGRCVFEFARGEGGLLELSTSDSTLIARLREMGYGEETGPDSPPPPPAKKAARPAAAA